MERCTVELYILLLSTRIKYMRSIRKTSVLKTKKKKLISVLIAVCGRRKGAENRRETNKRRGGVFRREAPSRILLIIYY